VFLIKCKILNMLDTFISLTNNGRGPQVLHAWFSVVDELTFHRTV